MEVLIEPGLECYCVCGISVVLENCEIAVGSVDHVLEANLCGRKEASDLVEDVNQLCWWSWVWIWVWVWLWSWCVSLDEIDEISDWEAQNVIVMGLAMTGSQLDEPRSDFLMKEVEEHCCIWCTCRTCNYGVAVCKAYKVIEADGCLEALNLVEDCKHLCDIGRWRSWVWVWLWSWCSAVDEINELLDW